MNIPGKGNGVVGCTREAEEDVIRCSWIMDPN